MLLLVGLFAVAFAQDGTTGGCTCKDPATLPTCTNDQPPYISGDPCQCLQCNRPACVDCPKPTVNCTREQKPRICFDCTNRTCCQQCNPVETVTCVTNCPATNLPPCGPTSTPPTCDKCPDCVRACDYSACPAQATLPVCTGDITREGCCDTCVPPPCTDAQRTECKTKIAAGSVPVCKDGEVAQFVNCCVSCVPPPPTSTTTDCTPEKVAAALATVPECQPGEQPVIIPDRCTKTCREAGTNCPPNTVTDFSNIKPCPDGVRPTFTGCTPDCVIPPPPCNPPCPTDQKCVRTADGLATTRCVKPDLCRTFAVAGIDANANPSDVFALVVRRHCEDVLRSAADKCELYEALLVGSLQCKRTGETRKDGDKVYTVVTCCHAPEPTINAAAGRRLLSGETLFGSAVNNPGATSGLQFQADTSSAAALTGFAGLLGLLIL